MKKILYLTYDGLTDPLGQSQVVAYLYRLSNTQTYIDIISFEKPDIYRENKKEVRKFFKNPTLRWFPLHYTKNPPVISTLIDLYKGWRLVKKLYAQEKYHIVHCRGYIMALLGLRLKRQKGVKFIFDMRGWWADEKVESGAWANVFFKPIYRYFKRQEALFFKESDFAVSLTEAGKQYAVEKGWKTAEKIGVIPTCVDFDKFPIEETFQNPNLRAEMNIPTTAKVLLYSGSLGGNYPQKIVIEAFEAFQELYPESFLLILSKASPEILTDDLKNSSINPEKIHLISVKYTSIHQYLKIADIGLIFYKQDFSVIGRSPTKLAEYWACGVPMVSASWIGDLKSIVQQYPFGGELIPDYNKSEWKEAFQRLASQEKKPEALRAAAEEFYHIKRGVAFYQSIYQELHVG